VGGRTDIVLIGGCGHVGLPLGLAFADRGINVVLYDVDARSVDLVNRGELPASEPGALDVLQRVVGTSLTATTDPTAISRASMICVVVGTPLGEHLSPDPQAVPRALEEVSEYFRDGQLLILRSTVYPGVTAQVERLFARLGLAVEVAFCPERIAEGRAMTELFELPQIVSARTPSAMERATNLFRTLTPTTVPLAPEEAELAKLFTNVWRYIKFAASNQLYMIANDFGVDFERVRLAIGVDYPRAADIAAAGFAAGPCLLKDTMQLAAFDNNNFSLGQASMMINEGLPQYVISRLEKRYHLEFLTVGILGMAFKAESDDVRSSLSYKLKRILSFKAAEVLCTDPYVSSDEDLLPLDEVIERSDLLVIAAPHAPYRDLDTSKPIIDIWNVAGRGVRV
jgi:UDP-N-acetyl-D-mannosaminuronic acid dehydrogenase